MAEKLNTPELSELVRKYFNVDSTTLGSQDERFIARYLGLMKSKNAEAGFEKLSINLKKHGCFASFRPFEDQQELIVFHELPTRKKNKFSINILMFLLTLLSVLFTGGLYAYQGEIPINTFQLIITLIKSGWPFAVSLLAILAAHEFGHYFTGRYHNVDVTLPLFIPFPFSTFGTMGAFISMRSIPKNKKELFDIALTGPLAGLFVSIIILLIGLNLSELNTIPLSSDEFIGLQMEGNSILYLFLKYISFNKILPNPANFSGISLLIFWAQFFFTGMPFPWGAEDVMLHPVAWAGWAGLFVTTINLIPVGQLDGGHIFQAVFGRKAMQFIYPIVTAFLVIFGFFWKGWWTWAVILFFFGQRYAEPLNQVTELDKKRKWLGYFIIFIFLITFIPVPITIAGV